MKIIIQHIPKSSKLTHRAEGPQVTMTGSESWPILGNSVPEKLIREVTHEYAGMNAHFDCLPKARRAWLMLTLAGIECSVGIGSLIVVSGDHKSEFGFYFNPPYEFHAWVELASGGILDIGLPGVIERGLWMSDENGPFLVDRSPVILAGKPESWMKYTTVEVRG